MAQLTDDCFAFSGDLLPVDEALSLLTKRLTAVVGTETVSLSQARQRVLAVDVIARRNVPPYDNSAVDGYAVYHADLNADAETVLPVRGRVAAGHPLNGPAGHGEAIRIFTGAPMPDGPDGGPDTVMMQEDCREEDGKVTLLPGIKSGSNRRKAGEDVGEGDLILKAGTRLEPQHIAMAASQGLADLEVYRPLRVAVLSTGDEVFEPGCDLPAGAIYDANRHMIAAMLENMGCTVQDKGILPDDEDSIARALAEAADENDLIVTSGGMSVGEEDHICNVIRQSGELNFWRLAIKPGRPVGMGQVKAGDGRVVPVFGLPGNPVAAFTTFTLIGYPMVQVMAGQENCPPRRYAVVLDADYKKKKGRREFVRARLTGRDESGLPKAVKHGASGAAIISSLVGADGFIDLGEDTTQITAGTVVDFLPFSEVLR